MKLILAITAVGVTAVAVCLIGPSGNEPVFPNQHLVDGGAVENRPIVVSEFTIGKQGRPILLPVAFHGRTLKFCLDTGSTTTAFDLTHRAELGEPIHRRRLKTPAGSSQLEVFKCPEASIGKLPLHSIREVGCIDLSPIRAATAEQIDGVLGMDFLRNQVFEVDFDKGTIRFFDRTIDAKADGTSKVGIDYDRTGLPFVTAKLCRVAEERFVLDTGSNSACLRTKVFDDLNSDSGLTGNDSHRAFLVTGLAKGKSANLQEFTLGPYTHPGLRFDRSSHSALGLRYFARYTALFDFQGNCLYLTKSSQFDLAERRATSGLSVVHLDKHKRVIAVDPGSPAAIAGIEPGDSIAQVNDVDVRDADMFTLGDMLTRRVGAVLKLVIHRNDRQFNTALTLQDRLAQRPNTTSR